MRIAVMAVSSLLAFTSGCVAHSHLRPEQLRALDGYDAKPQVPERVWQVEDVDGKSVEVGDAPILELLPKDPEGEEKGGRFASISVKGDSFQGRLRSGETVALDLNTVDSAVLTRRSPAKIAFLVVGIVASVAATAYVVANPPSLRFSGPSLNLGGGHSPL